MAFINDTSKPPRRQQQEVAAAGGLTSSARKRLRLARGAREWDARRLLQRMVRGMLARGRVRALRLEEAAAAQRRQQEEAAAIGILQRVVRGRQARAMVKAMLAARLMRKGAKDNNNGVG